MTNSQNNQIAQHLKEGKTLTALEALKNFGTLRLAARIHDLKEQGHNVETRIVSTLSGKRIAQYSLKQ